MNRTLNAFIVSVVVASSARAQDSSATIGSTSGMKDRGTAGALGLMPGVGHMYAGEFGNGLGILAATVGGFVVGVEYVKRQVDACPASQPTCPSGDGSQLVSIVALGAAVYAWGYSVIDAPKAADRYNKKHGVAPVVTTGAHGSTRLGVSLAF